MRCVLNIFSAMHSYLLIAATNYTEQHLRKIKSDLAQNYKLVLLHSLYQLLYRVLCGIPCCQRTTSENHLLRLCD